MNRRANGLPSGPRRVVHSNTEGEQAPTRPLRTQKSAANLSGREEQAHPTLRTQKSVASLPSRSIRPAAISRPTTPSQINVSEPQRRIHKRRPSESSAASWSGSTLSASSTSSSSSASSVISYSSQSSNDSADIQPSLNAGNYLWDRVAGVASALTVNVSKAWTANISIYSGEETPPGGETRLSRALKAYHLDKARDPTDLPRWLFEEHERRGPSPEPAVAQKIVEPPRPTGLRDVYAAASAIAPVQRAKASPYADEYRLASKATDRLKALRDAKRAANTPSMPAPEMGTVDNYDLDGRRTPEIPARNTPSKRIGLPQHPKRF